MSDRKPETGVQSLPFLWGLLWSFLRGLLWDLLQARTGTPGSCMVSFGLTQAPGVSWGLTQAQGACCGVSYVLTGALDKWGSHKGMSSFGNSRSFRKLTSLSTITVDVHREREISPGRGHVALVGSSSARVGAPARRHVSSVSHRLRGVSTAMWPASVAAPASRSGPAVPLWAQALARPYPVPTGQAAYTSEACSHSPWALLEDLSRHLEASEDVGDEGALGLKTHPSHRSSLPLFLQGHRAHPRPACTIPITSAKTSFPTEVTFQLLRARACMHLLGGTV